MEETATAMTTFLGNIGTVLDSSIDWVGSCAEMVINTPLLLVPTILGIGLIGIGIIKRFI